MNYYSFHIGDYRRRRTDNLTNSYLGASMSVQTKRSVGIESPFLYRRSQSAPSGSGFFMFGRSGRPSGLPFPVDGLSTRYCPNTFLKGSVRAQSKYRKRPMSAPTLPPDRSNVIPFRFALPTKPEEMFADCITYDSGRETYGLYQWRMNLLIVVMETALERKYQQKYPGGLIGKEKNK